MAAIAEECVFCSAERVVGFCENCNCKLGSKCFQNHKLIPVFADHVMYAFENVNPPYNDESVFIKLRNEAKEDTDMHNQACEIHETETTRLYCENHNVPICVRCLRLSHKDCINDTIDFLDIKLEELNATESLSALAELEDEIAKTEKAIAENIKLNKEGDTILKKEIETYFLKLTGQLLLMKNEAENAGSVKHNLNNSVLDQLAVECEDIKMMVSEKKKLIKRLVENKHQGRLYVAVRSLCLETANIKTKLRNIDHNNHIEKINLEPNEDLQKVLFSNNTVIGTLQETTDGSDECNEVQVKSMNVSGLPFRNNKRMYKTLSGILVYVYQADICSLNVDCIVNSANSRLQHGGGVAAVIQRKAGDELRIEVDEYIRSHGEIQDGDVVTTRAGKLPYKYILHAVGPRWSDYDTRTKRGEGDCRVALQNAIFNSFLKASELQLKSVALQPISSAIFGVPMQICTEEYVQAVLMYSGVGADSSLREIHFVDILPGVVTQIQTRFDKYVKKGDLSKADQFGTASLRDGKTNVKPNQPSELGFHKGTKVTKISEQELKDQGQCVICMDDFTNPKTLGCGHIFCTDCINQSFSQKHVCPTCGQICGIIKGDQPPGTMTIKRESWECCAGYQHVGRICITYSFNSGTQTENHPVPGKWYKGISRRGFLPDNKDGADVCRMLKVAFQRKLVFTIGSARTTGEEGVITWNDIHHKTDHRPNTQFGYPDPSYLERVTDELKAKGVTHADIDPNDRLEDTVYCM